jgi:hypothetical protein
MSLRDLGEEISSYSFQLAFSFVLGLGLGLGVFAKELSIYSQWRHKHKKAPLYTGAGLWKFILVIFLVIILFLDKMEKPIDLVAFSGGIYLLTLAYVFFRIRNNKPPIVT